jgi:RHS repeat-associated protein
MILGALLLSLALPSTPPPSSALLPGFPPAVASNTSPFDVSVDLKLSPPSHATRLSQSGTPTGPRPYFGARYYGSKIGRFTTTDPFVDQRTALVDPQRWNRYSYGRNNPLRYVDPDGRDIVDYFTGAANAVGSNFAFGA